MQPKPMMPPDAWREYCLLKRRAEYLEIRYSYRYSYRREEIDAAYEDVSWFRVPPELPIP